MQDPVALLVGVLLVAIGAVSATLTQRRLETQGRATTAPLWLVHFGILIGAGAAIVRGWDLAASMVAGAVLVPVVGAVGRHLEVRRHRRADRVGDR